MTPGEGLTLAAYGVGGLAFYLEARRRRLATDGVAIVAGAAFLGGIAGAILGQALGGGNPSALGRALFAGVLGGWIAVEIAKRAIGLRRSTGDLFALAIPAGEAVGRIGCWFNGCCHGKAYDGPLAVWQHDAWRFPAQFASSLAAAITLVVLLGLRGRMRREGYLFRAYLVLFAVTRFGLEFLREGYALWLGLTTMQWVCVEMLAGLGLYAWARHRRAIRGDSGEEASETR